MKQGEAGLHAGQVRVSSGWFDYTKPPRTTFLQGKQDYRAVSSEFGVVRPHLTSSNHCDLGGSRPTGKVRVSLGRFDLTEPPRTTVMKGDAGIQRSLKFGVVQLYRTTSNLLEPWHRRSNHTCGGA